MLAQSTDPGWLQERLGPPQVGVGLRHLSLVDGTLQKPLAMHGHWLYICAVD